MGLFDRLKNAGNILTEPSQFSNEELTEQADMGRDPREQMQGEGLLKLLRAGAAVLPDDKENAMQIAPPMKFNLFGHEVNLPEQRFDPTGAFSGGIQSIANKMGPASEALKALQFANKDQQASKLRNFLSNSNVLQAENSAQALGKVPNKPLGKVLVDTGEASATPNFGKIKFK